MRTPADANNIIYQKLNEADFKTSLALTGSIYKNNRPINSGVEDIVINNLGLPNRDVQNGVSNVNIFVPNLKLRLNGLEDNTQPDLIRLDALTKLVISQIDEIYNGDYWFYIQQVSDAMLDENDQSYINIRVNFNSVNT